VPLLHIQEFLYSNTLQNLKEQFAIKAQQHPQHASLYHFTYDQIESPSSHPIVQECRGLILDSARGWEVVAFPFRRFANLGESWASQIDWRTARAQEKLDGSMMTLWNYEGRWHVSTKGSPDAGGPVGDLPFTFNHLFWKTFSNQFLELYVSLSAPADARRFTLNPDYTYVFELTTPWNRVVCNYGAEERLTLIGVRENFGEYREIPVEDYADFLPVVREYPTYSDDSHVSAEILDMAAALDPIAHEGFVVVDEQFRRVKIKSPKYVELHHLRTAFSLKRLLRIYRLGETSEVLAYFPEYRPMIDAIDGALNEFVAKVMTTWEGIRHIQDRKTFAMFATKYTYFSFPVRSLWRKNPRPSVVPAGRKAPNGRVCILRREIRGATRTGKASDS
jgi:hypothetical protein